MHQGEHFQYRTEMRQSKNFLTANINRKAESNCRSFTGTGRECRSEIHGVAETFSNFQRAKGVAPVKHPRLAAWPKHNVGRHIKGAAREEGINSPIDAARKREPKY